jgi:hypothetical protein
VPLQILGAGENPRALQDEVDAEVVPRQVRRVTLGERRIRLPSMTSAPSAAVTSRG